MSEGLDFLGRVQAILQWDNPYKMIFALSDESEFVAI